MDVFPDLRSFLEALERDGDLTVVDCEVDPRLELAEIHRRVIAAGGPALLFTKVRGSAHRVVTNLFGTARRVERAFGRRPEAFIAAAAKLPHELMPPSLGKLWKKRGFFKDLLGVGLASRSSGPITEVIDRAPDLTRIGALTTWSLDGGPFLTLPLVYTEHPQTGQSNLGMYRMQVKGPRTTGMHFQIGKGGGFHLAAAEELGRALPLNCFLGGPPALILAAIAPLPENVPEMLLASLVLGKKLPMVRTKDSPLPLPADAEFVLMGEVRSKVREPEGPFGDHYGYYSLIHDYPVFDCKAVARRSDAILPATVVGKPRQEDFFIGDFLQELLSPLFPIAMPAVRDLWSYGETGYHSLAAAVVRERYRREAMASAFRILGEGQLALTKFLLVTDRPVDLRNFRATLEHILARTDVRTDLYVFSNLSMDSLDYTGPKVNEGSKGVWLGLGDPKRSLPRAFSGELPQGFARPTVYCGGCLVVEGPSFVDEKGAPARLARAESLRPWPLVVLVDDAPKAARSDMNFLWTTFTRFEPASDIHTPSARIERHHIVLEPPVVIDARKKPNLPDELFCDPPTAKTVSGRWHEYFPKGQEMGNSDAAHLD